MVNKTDWDIVIRLVCYYRQLTRTRMDPQQVGHPPLALEGQLNSLHPPKCTSLSGKWVSLTPTSPQPSPSWGWVVQSQLPSASTSAPPGWSITHSELRDLRAEATASLISRDLLYAPRSDNNLFLFAFSWRKIFNYRDISVGRTPLFSVPSTETPRSIV